ncbi:hypothetical protein [Lysinibacillus xylanilyticus]|uniref:hypothetical protein n=1 Tax=Lysinibacillus xylanilyticus TaxID=582475 RepID=UPI003CFBF7CE
MLKRIGINRSCLKMELLIDSYISRFLVRRLLFLSLTFSNLSPNFYIHLKEYVLQQNEGMISVPTGLSKESPMSRFVVVVVVVVVAVATLSHR